MWDITLSSGMRFRTETGVSILDAATVSGISLPYSCRTGRCSSCKCKIVSGETSALADETGLTAQEKTEGWILSCVRVAKTDLTLDVEDLGGIQLPPARTLPCRIQNIEKLAPDVVRILLRLPPTTEFTFMPGQYIEIIGPGGIRRSYSIATAGFTDKTLELHIRAVQGGVVSDYWFNHAKPNDLLRLNGPLGTFFLRDAASMDLVFLATGTGIAPVKAILESLSELEPGQCPGSVTVLWGGRIPEDLYLDINAMPGDHQFIPVLSRAGDGWLGARGHVQDVLLDQRTNLLNTVVYACGSDAMIKSARSALLQAGLPGNRFHSDAFVCSSAPFSDQDH